LIPLWVDGSINLTKQDETQVSNTSKIVKQDGRIKWEEDAQSISRKVRAYSPWPGTFSTWRGKNFKLISVKIGDLVSKKRHGKLSGSATEGLYVSTGKGIIEIKSLQIEGKQLISAKEFMIGYPDFEKDVLI
jgi:methionyl-tRNA formyltransferase